MFKPVIKISSQALISAASLLAIMGTAAIAQDQSTPFVTVVHPVDQPVAPTQETVCFTANYVRSFNALYDYRPGMEGRKATDLDGLYLSQLHKGGEYVEAYIECDTQKIKGNSLTLMKDYSLGRSLDQYETAVEKGSQFHIPSKECPAVRSAATLAFAAGQDEAQFCFQLDKASHTVLHLNVTLQE